MEALDTLSLINCVRQVKPPAIIEDLIQTQD
jgi:hypothetical protein